MYEAGLAALRERGFSVDAPADVRPQGYLAGPDEVRLERLNTLLTDDDVDAIFCVRGGYGTMRLLDEVDYDAAGARPKLIVGYSDVTALQLALFARAGVPSIAGPMVAPDWSRMDDFSETAFWRLAGGDAPVEIFNPDDKPMGTLHEGEAEGTLIGGNLTMLVSMLGTRYMPSLEGAILFLEEIGEAPYRVDRHLATLQLAGVFDQIAGLVLGAFTDCGPPPDRPSLALGEVIKHYARFVDGPVAAGLVFGHLRPKVSLPVGTRARLSAEERRATLTIIEPITA